MTSHRESPGRRVVPLGLALLALFSMGCTRVMTVEPLGSEPVALDPERWDGVWCGAAAAGAHLSGTPIDERDCVTLTVLDSREGTLAVHDSSSTEPDTSAIVRGVPGTDVTFLTIPYPADTPEGAYWVRVRMGNGLLLYWEPRADAFRALVEAGSLPGSTSEDDIVLFPLDVDQLALIGRDEAELFTWQDPEVLVRLRP